MSSPLARAIVGAIVVAAIGCKADLPRLTDASEPLDATCSGPYADLVVDVFPTTLDASPALGAPDAAGVALAPEHVVTLGFIGIGAITDAPGVDLQVHATVAAGASGVVRVAATDREFRFVGNLDEAQNEFDLQIPDVNAAVYVRVVGVSGQITVDAVQATHDTCP